jgi:diadenosine tetraphosphate (Ap4A) HIT family hydrolase
METSELIYKSENWILRHSEKEKNIPGYLYLEPIRHVEEYSKFNSLEFQEIGIFIEKGIQWIYNYSNPKKIYTVTVSEAVPHIHFHIVPRYIDSVKGLEYLALALSGKFTF